MSLDTYLQLEQPRGISPQQTYRELLTGFPRDSSISNREQEQQHQRWIRLERPFTVLDQTSTFLGLSPIK
jgi:hypothetical protein